MKQNEHMLSRSFKEALSDVMARDVPVRTDAPTKSSKSNEKPVVREAPPLKIELASVDQFIRKKRIS